MKIFRENGANVLELSPLMLLMKLKKVTKNIFQDYLSVDLANHIVSNYEKPDIITFTNVFAHIENLDEVIFFFKKSYEKNNTNY